MRSTISLLFPGAAGFHLFAFACIVCCAMTSGLAGLAQIASAQTPPAQTAPVEVLTNEMIAKMVELKLGDGLISSKIKTSNCSFQTAIGDIMKLKAAGVSDAVIQAMVEAGAASNTAADAAKNSPPPDPNDPRSPHDAGVYWLSKENTAKEMVALEPTVYSGAKSAGVFAAAMTSGIAKVKMKAVVRGGRASLRMVEDNPEFWFYFEEKSHSLSNVWFWAGASSPNEFVLAKLSAKKNERELVVGEANLFGGSSGTQSKDTVELKIERLAPGVYRVTPEGPIPPGEYCFFYAGGDRGKLFDFGIDPPK
ncbi:MAG: hypothetical protein DMG50_18000 [Acidobacteria bacterium]|nr:MAG: hypothetical protein DMG50_18000 [Acidobacteriota bacterium]